MNTTCGYEIDDSALESSRDEAKSVVEMEELDITTSTDANTPDPKKTFEDEAQNSKLFVESSNEIR